MPSSAKRFSTNFCHHWGLEASDRITDTPLLPMVTSDAILKILRRPRRKGRICPRNITSWLRERRRQTEEWGREKESNLLAKFCCRWLFNHILRLLLLLLLHRSNLKQGVLFDFFLKKFIVFCIFPFAFVSFSENVVDISSFFPLAQSGRPGVLIVPGSLAQNRPQEIYRRRERRDVWQLLRSIFRFHLFLYRESPWLLLNGGKMPFLSFL